MTAAAPLGRWALPGGEAVIQPHWLISLAQIIKMRTP
jgi:hypothetical protein